MILHCPQCSRDIEAPNTALGKRVQCPLCGQAFTATLPKAVVMEGPSSASLESPPPGFADYHAAPPAAKSARAKDLIAKPVDEEDLDVIELTEVVQVPRRTARRPARPADGVGEITDILQGRGGDDQGPMSDTLAALYGQAPAGRHVNDANDEDGDADVQPTALAEEEVDEALSALSGVGGPAAGAGYVPSVKANQWYIVSGEVEFGPFTGQVILAAVRAGKLTPPMILHDGADEVEVSVAQLLQALARQGVPRTSAPPKAARSAGPAQPPAPAPAQPAPAQPAPSSIPGLAADGTSAVSPAAPSSPPASPAASSAAASLAALAAAAPDVALAQAATAAFQPVQIRRHLPWALSDTAVLLAGLALALAAAALLLPWLRNAPSIRTGLRLGDLARPWAHAFGWLTLGGWLLVGALLLVRRWRGRRLACGCLIVLCLASLVVQALALGSIREVWQISVHMGMLGLGAWLAAAGALGGGFFAGLAAATAEPRG